MRIKTTTAHARTHICVLVLWIAVYAFNGYYRACDIHANHTFRSKCPGKFSGEFVHIPEIVFQVRLDRTRVKGWKNDNYASYRRTAKTRQIAKNLSLWPQRKKEEKKEIKNSATERFYNRNQHYIYAIVCNATRKTSSCHENLTKRSPKLD